MPPSCKVFRSNAAKYTSVVDPGLPMNLRKFGTLRSWLNQKLTEDEFELLSS